MATNLEQSPTRYFSDTAYPTEQSSPEQSPSPKEVLHNCVNTLSENIINPVEDGFLTSQERLSQKGKNISYIIFEKLGSFTSEEIKQTCSQKRPELTRELDQLKKQMRAELTQQWKKEGRKKRGNMPKFEAELYRDLVHNPSYLHIQLQRRILSSLTQKAVMRSRQREIETVMEETDETNLLEFAQKLDNQGKTLGNHKSIATNPAFLRNAFYLHATKRRKEQLQEMEDLGLNERDVQKYLKRVNKKRIDSISLYSTRERMINEMKPIITKKRQKRKIAIAAALSVPSLLITSFSSKPNTGESTRDSLKSSVVYQQKDNNTSDSLFTELDFSQESKIKPFLESQRDLSKTIQTYANLSPNLEFIDPEVGSLGIYRQVLFEPKYNINQYPLELTNWIQSLEGPVQQNSLDFLSRLGFRNGKYLLNIGNSIPSGCSDIATQLAELISGGYNQFLLNPDNPANIHHPELYSVEYLFNLLQRVLIQSSNITIEKSQIKPPSIPDNSLSQDAINQLCCKFESYLVGKELVHKHGVEKVLIAYLNFVQLGAKDGLPIYGLPAASQAYFNKDISELNQAEIISLIGLIQSPANYSEEGNLKKRAFTLLNILKDKNIINNEKYIEIFNELVDLSIVEKPNTNNSWINNLNHEHQRQIYQIINDIKEGRNITNRYEASNSNHPLITIYLEPLPYIESKSPQKKIDTTYLEPTILELPPYQAQLNRQISEALTRNSDGTYTFTIPKPDEPYTITLPEFEDYPGLSVVLVDAEKNDKQVIAEYDETGILSNSPFSPGSSIKPFVAAWLITELDINPYITRFDNSPGKYTIAHPSLTVRNANWKLNEIRPDNQLTLAEALATSSNVVFQKLLKQYIDNNPTNGWNNFTSFLSNFGLNIVDINGKPIKKPTDYPAIGSDICISNLSSHALALAELVNPKSSTNSKYSEAYQLVTDILSNQELKLGKTITGQPNVWAKDSLTFFDPNSSQGIFLAKTGTVSIYSNNGKITTTDLLTIACLITPNGKTYTCAVRISGQKDGETINIEDIERQSTDTALPIARYLLETTATNPIKVHDIPNPEEALELLDNEINLKNNQQKHYQVSTTNKDTIVYDKYGNPIHTLKKNETFDCLGMPKDNYQSIAINIGNNQIITGFIKETDISSIIINYCSNIQQRKSLETFLDTISIYKPELSEQKSAYQEKVNYIIISENSSSPFLAHIAKDMNKRKQLTAGREDYQPIFDKLGDLPKYITFINGDMLPVYLQGSDNDFELSEGQKALSYTLRQQENYFKLSEMLKNYCNMDLYYLLWDNNGYETPAKLLLDIYTKHPIMQTDDDFNIIMQITARKSNPLYITVGSLLEIFTLNHKPSTEKEKKQKVKKLAQLLENINNTQDPQILHILGYQYQITPPTLQ